MSNTKISNNWERDIMKIEALMAFSNISYINIDSLYEGLTLRHMGVPLFDGSDIPVDLSHPIHSNIKDPDQWVLIKVLDLNHQSGFYGMAFKKRETGEMVFALRGTDKDLADHMPIPEDVITDFQIALPGKPLGEPNQFADAYQLLKETLGPEMTEEELVTYVQNNNIIFTGHSLGGALCQYLTYRTGGRSIIFNGVGIGQVVDIEACSNYNVTNYIYADDIIGNYGLQLGKVVYLQGCLDKSLVNISLIACMLDVVTAIESDLIGKLEGALLLNSLYKGTNKETQTYMENQLQFKDHLIDSMLWEQDGQWVLKPQVSQSNVQELTDAFYRYSSALSSHITRSRILEIVRDMDWVIHEAYSVSETVVELESECRFVVDQSLDATKRDFDEVITFLSCKIRENIIECSHGVEHIQTCILQGLNDINREITNVLNSFEIKIVGDMQRGIVEGIYLKEVAQEDEDTEIAG